MAQDTQQTTEPLAALDLKAPTSESVKKTSEQAAKELSSFLSDQAKINKQFEPGKLGEQIQKFTDDAQKELSKAIGSEASGIIADTVNSIFGVFMAGIDSLAALWGAAKAIDEYGAQLGREEIQPTLNTVGELLEIYRRSPDKVNDIDLQLQKWGYNDQRISNLKELAYGLLSQAEILDSWLRGYITESDADNMIQQHGYVTAQIDLKKRLAHRVPDMEQAILFNWFGLTTDEQFRQQALAQGWDSTLAENIKDVNQWIPSPVEALINARHGAFEPDLIQKWGLHNLLPPEFIPEMQKKGLNKDTALQYWAGHWAPLSNPNATKLFQRGEMSQSELFEIYHLNGLAQGAWPLEMQSRYLVPEYFVLSAMTADSNFTQQQIHDMVHDMGYRPKDVSLIAQTYYKKQTSSSTAKLQTQLEKAYKSGALSKGQAEKALAQIGLTDNQVLQVMQQIEVQVQVESTDELLKVIRHDYVEKFIDEQAAVQQMLTEGFTSQQIDYYMSLWRNERKMYKKRLTEAQVGHLYKDGHISSGTAVTRWEGMGYTQEDAQLLLLYYA